MGALGNDVTVHTSDVALMSGDLRRLADLLLLSSKTVNIINQNLLCGFGFIIVAIALSWFEQDPTAARDWLAMQTTYDDLQPAISYIVSRISEKGDLKTALEWSALLKDGTLRDDTIFDIHALALRNGKITVSEIMIFLSQYSRAKSGSFFLTER